MYIQTKCSLSLGMGNFTVFAPNDDAFVRVPENELDDLINNTAKLSGNTFLPNIFLKHSLFSSTDLMYACDLFVS